jgi:hypothetical protein
MIIEFGEYLPDLPVFNNPGATVAKNVMPSGNSYKSFPSLTVYSDALSAMCKGAVAGRDATSGNSVNFAGDASKLYKMTAAAWSDVSKSGGYNAAVDERWFFTQFGNRVIACNISDPIQTYTIGSSSAFADLSASAPNARYISGLRNFLVGVNTQDSTDGYVPVRVRWCAFGDPTTWTVSATTQADFQDLDASFGWCKQIVGGEYGVVFQERAITRMTYVGSPIVFQFDRVEENQGTQAPGSVIKFGNYIAFLGLDGFRIFDGSQSIPIGANKIDKTFFADVDTNYLHRICAAVDYTNQLLIWAYPGAGNTSGRCNKLVLYHYAPNATKHWSMVDALDIEFLYNSLAEGYTLEQLDSFSASLDNLPFSLDSRVWTGNNLLLSAFDANHKLNNFTGDALTGTIETQEAQITPMRRTNLLNVRPLIDGGDTVTVQIGTRNILSETVSYSSAASVNSIGECPVRSNAQYHRARVNISGGFTHAQGIEVLEAYDAGRR